MYPAEKKPGVFLDQYSEIDILQSAVAAIMFLIPEEQMNDVVALLPDVEVIMDAHAKRLRRFWRRRRPEPPQPNLFLSPRQAAAASIILAWSVEFHKELDPMVAESSLILQDEIAENLALSRQYNRRARLIWRQED